jgi:hypothetical protein
MVTLDFIKIGLSGVLETLRSLVNVVIWYYFISSICATSSPKPEIQVFELKT